MKKYSIVVLFVVISTLGRTVLADDENNPFYSIHCGSERACAQEQSYVPGQYLSLSVVMVDHLIVEITDKMGVSLVIPYTDMGNVRPPQGSVELRFTDGRPTITLGQATLIDQDGGLYAIHLSPTIEAKIATVGHGTVKVCDPGGVFGAVTNTFEVEKNLLTLKMADGNTVNLQSDVTTKQIGSHPALFGCH